MCKALVHSQFPVTMIGGSPFSKGDFDICQRLAPVLVAADSGADQIMALGHIPEAVIGDLDSLSLAARTTLPPARLHHLSEQETTDFDKALRSIDAPYTLALGFSGGRLDHALAVMNSLIRHTGRKCILVGEEDVCFALPKGRHLINIVTGDRVSLYPFAPVRAKSRGLTWPLDDLDFAPQGFIATSNIASQSEIIIEAENNGFLLILPKSRLKAAIDCVTSFTTLGA